MTVWTRLPSAGWAGDARENAEAIARDFQQYLEANRDDIEALTIFYSQPHRRSELTYSTIRDVLDKLKSDRPLLAPLRVWQAYVHLDDYRGSQPISELTALVALIRRVCGIDETDLALCGNRPPQFPDLDLETPQWQRREIQRSANGMVTLDPGPHRHVVSLWTTTTWTWLHSTARADWDRCTNCSANEMDEHDR